MEAPQEQTLAARREFGRRVAAARTARGWTQRALANALDITTGTVSRWERGENMPETKVLIELAHALNRDPGYFVAHLDDPSLNGDGEPSQVADELSQLRAELAQMRGMLERALRDLDP